MSLYTTDIFKQALYFSAEKHDGQYRKGGKTPYIVHPVMVAFMVAQYTDKSETIAAALLHDVVEDCNVSLNDLEKEFGKEITSLVNEVSFIPPSSKKDMSWRTKKSLYLDKIKHSSNNACIIIAADKITNMSAYFKMLKTNPDIVQKSFNGTVEDYVWYYTEIKKILVETLADHPIVEKYTQVLASAIKIER